DLRAAYVSHRQQKICGWRILGDNVTVTLHSAMGAADEHSGRIVPIVCFTVAHTAPPVQHRVIEQITVTLWGRLQLLEELGELRDLVSGDLGVFGELRRIVA